MAKRVSEPGDSDRIETGTTAIEYVEPGIEDAPETRFEVSARMCSETARNNARTRMNDQGMNEPSPRNEIDHTANSGACVLGCLRRPVRNRRWSMLHCRHVVDKIRLHSRIRGPHLTPSLAISACLATYS